MVKKILLTMISSSFFLVSIVCYVAAELPVPPAADGVRVIVQHLGKLKWPQDDETSTPYLTQLSANDINDDLKIHK